MVSGVGIGDIVNTYLTQFQSNSMNSLAQISQQLVARLNAEKKDVAVDFTRSDMVRASTEQAQLMSYKTKIADEVSAVTKAKGAIGWVTSKLDTMLANAQALLGSTDPAARAQAASDFNAAIDFINSKVDDAGQTINYRSINIVGGGTVPDFKADNLYIHTNDSGTYAMVTGAYMGAKFNIQDADGDLWQFSAQDNAYHEYKSDGTGEPTGQTISGDGLTVDSYDPDTGAVTLGGSGSLTGTVVKGGIGVLTSDYYGNFADDTSVQQAIDDLNSALDYVSQKGASITANATLLINSDRVAGQKISDLDGEISKISNEELDEATAKSKAAQLKLSLAVNNINLTQQHNTSLIQNLLDSTQGQGPAFGVFGQLGY